MGVKTAKKVQEPKFHIINMPALMRMLHGALRGKIPKLPKGCTHAVYSPTGEMDPLTALWETEVKGKTTLCECEVLGEVNDVVLTDAWGVKCLQRGGLRLDEYKVLQLLIKPQQDVKALNAEIKARPSKDPRPKELQTKVKPAFFFKKGKAPKGKQAMDVINDNGRLLNWEGKRAGFWRQNVNFTRDDTLPFPVVTTARGYDKVAKGKFLLRLAEVEHLALVNRYRGWSQHRWTGEANGSTEFFFRDWRWPAGYSTYLKAGVLPSREFYQFITGEDLASLPSYNKENAQ
ncbi:hypothetical protein O152_gp020 [Pseudomonas phage PaBG]|nr:hypothetical protein O152_gp020 [Pseudomonas phage PaBG]AGS81904.2 hypothetical protein PaBG_00020 [Pseudomonas phage PaBG]